MDGRTGGGVSVLLAAIVVAVVDLLAQIRKDLPEVGHGVSPPAKWIFNGSGIFPELDEAELRLAVGAAVGVGAAGGAAGTAGGHHGHAAALQQPHDPGRQGHLALAEHAGRAQGQDARRPLVGQGGHRSGGKRGRHIGKRQVEDLAVDLRRPALCRAPAAAGMVGKVDEHRGIPPSVGVCFLLTPLL